MDVQVSEAQQVFIIHGIQDNLRTDGRKILFILNSNDDYRPIILETDLINNTSGSARIRLGNTDILVGIKVEIDSPTADVPDCGRLQFFVDCSANATPEFEGRGGDDLAQDISDCLTKAYSKCYEETKKLCIVREQLCWLLYVDVVILECDGGNLYDCVSLAVKSALHDLKIPNAKPIFNEKQRADVEISDDIYDVWRLNVAEFPVLVTLGKIGVDAVVDMTAEEEKCQKSGLIVGVSGRQVEDCRITLIRQKDNPGSLDPDSVSEMINAAVKIGVKLNEKLLKKLNETDNRNETNVKGFLS